MLPGTVTETCGGAPFARPAGQASASTSRVARAAIPAYTRSAIRSRPRRPGTDPAPEADPDPETEPEPEP
ncbi:hypothetical protein GCM10010519_33930 [Streptomyces lactacystinicus]